MVSEHHLAEGDASLTVTPFDRLDLAGEPVRRRFWELLHVDEPSRLTRLEPDAAARDAVRWRGSWRCRPGWATSPAAMT
nr:hypothetical protein GCM10020093_090960 [Planobispora longispora]